MIFVSAGLDREQTSAFNVVARVQLRATPAQVVNVRVELSVDDVNDCEPQFTFPSPGSSSRSSVAQWLSD